MPEMAVAMDLRTSFVVIAAGAALAGFSSAQVPPKQVVNCFVPAFPGPGGFANPCDGNYGIAMGHVGYWVVPFKIGDEFDVETDVVGAGTVGEVRRITRMHGCAGMYDSIALVKPASTGWLDGGTASSTELSGSKRWVSGFCSTPECECNPNAHLWDFDYSVISKVEISLNFNNGVPNIGAAAGAALAKVDIPFPPGQILVNVNATGQENSAEVTLNAWAYQGEAGASFTLTKTISADTWIRTIPATASRVGSGKRGCGFIGRSYTIQGTTSASSTIEIDAVSAFSRGSTFISEGAGTWVLPYGDICINPLELGRSDRQLRDGTPVTQFLEVLAELDLPAHVKSELLYAANVWGPETDYYAWLLSKKSDVDLEEFYESIDTEAVGIASIEDFFEDPERSK